MDGIFDSHAHYDVAAFDEDREALLASMPSAGIGGILQVSSDLNSSLASVKLAEAYPFIWAGVGIHPESAQEDPALLQPLIGHPKVVAVGEIGLDYHYDDGVPRERQMACFAAQLELAEKAGLPVVVHDREAHEDTMKALRAVRVRGVVHCFSGSAEMVRELIRRGFYIGLGGVVTFKNARKALEVVDSLPLERLLLETDAPYLAPAPFRGKRCDSRMIPYTAAVIAARKGLSVDRLIDQTRENARTLFGISQDA